MEGKQLKCGGGGGGGKKNNRNVMVAVVEEEGKQLKCGNGGLTATVNKFLATYVCIFLIFFPHIFIRFYYCND